MRFWIVPSVVLGTSGLTIWYYLYNKNINSQKYGATLFKGIMYHLRHNDKVEQELGSKIKFHSTDQVKGNLNSIKGKADISFPVTGTKNSGVVHFSGLKINQGNQWETQKFVLHVNGGETIVDIE